jgi:hypothetical protein
MFRRPSLQTGRSPFAIKSVPQSTATVSNNIEPRLACQRIGERLLRVTVQFILFFFQNQI